MKKTGISALIVDYGGVISKPQNLDYFQEILQNLGIDENRFIGVYQAQRNNYDNGQLSGKEYWQKIFQNFGLEPDEPMADKLIQADVKSWTEINGSMIRFLQESRGEVGKLAIISNMMRDTLAHMRNHFDWLEIFDDQIYSCEIGINKPDARIYEICLNSLDVKPHACLFVDDSQKNVSGAVESEMNAIHYKSFAQFSQEFRKAYFLIGDPV
jgi:putative hydrolase of the HAD superfamily